ncbi:MAG: DUF3298 and DUF4163 domain-containing protein [Victivallaceae bacterium]|nr:DUF3298 and DUF4163 domain-containing protein [Victivallaceae bacterium]
MVPLKRFRAAAAAAALWTVMASCAADLKNEAPSPPLFGDAGFDLKSDPFVSEAIDIAGLRDEYGFIATNQAGAFTDKTDKNVVFIDGRIVSVLIEKYYYLGGAHGTRIFQGASFERTSGKKVTLDDIAPGERRAELTERLRKTLETHLKKIGASPEELDRLPEPTENFYFAEDGLHMIYNEYELGAFGLGCFNLCIDWPHPASR